MRKKRCQLPSGRPTLKASKQVAEASEQEDIFEGEDVNDDQVFMTELDEEGEPKEEQDAVNCLLLW